MLVCEMHEEWKGTILVPIHKSGDIDKTLVYVLETLKLTKRDRKHSFIHSFIHSFTLFSVYPYTGENQGCGNCHSCSYKKLG